MKLPKAPKGYKIQIALGQVGGLPKVYAKADARMERKQGNLARVIKNLKTIGTGKGYFVAVKRRH